MMKLIKVCLAITAQLFLITTQILGQEGLINEDGVQPPPSVASLGNYLDNPVSTFTGKPDISIPLYTVKTPNLTLPISISYSTEDIKVDNLPGNAGFGWSLNVGGVVSATFYGPPDANTFANGNTRSVPWQELGATSPSDPPLWVVQTVHGDKDLEPDLFFFNYPGGGGKFVLDDIGNPLHLEKSLVKVGYTVAQNNYNINDFYEWQITDDNGTKYYYGGIQKPVCLASVMDHWGSNTYFINTWYLSRIESPYGDWIDLEYESTHGNQNGVRYYVSKHFEAEYLVSDNSVGLNEAPRDLEPQGVSYIDRRVSRITTSTGEEIIFEGHNPNSIIFLFDTISIVGKYDVVLDYSIHNDVLTQGVTNEDRPRLNKVTVGDMVYSFSYNDSIPLPPRGSYAQDLWGYYNGKLNNPHLIPSLTISSKQVNYDLSYDVNELVRWGYFEGLCNPLFDRWVIPGADRKTDPDYITAGVLQSITFPTGGKKQFVFEPHDFSYVQSKKLNIKEYTEYLVGTVSTPEGMTINTLPFILSESHKVRIHTVFQTNTSANNLNEINRPIIKLFKEGVATPIYELRMPAIEGYSYTDEIYLDLGLGTYTLQLESSNESPPGISESSVNRIDVETSKKSLGGGLRIKSVSFDPMDGSEPITTSYDYSAKYGLESQGVLFKYPIHARVIDPNSFVISYWDPDLKDNITVCNFKIKTYGSAISQLSSIQAPIVSYNQVTSSKIENGKTIETYPQVNVEPIETNVDAPNLPDYSEIVYALRDKYPFSPFQRDYFLGYDWNLLIQSKNLNNNDSIKLEQQFQYEFISLLNTGEHVTGMKIATEPGDNGLRYYYKPYQILQSIGNYLKYKGTKNFFEDTVLVNKEFYYKDSQNHRYTTRSQVQKSDGTLLTTKYYYPIDYSSQTAPWINALQTKNMHATPLVEQVVNNGKLINSNVIEYIETNGKVYPYKVYINEEVVDSDTIWQSNPIYTNQIENHMNSLELTEFGLYGRVLERKAYNSPIQSYFWGYSGMYPVAKFENMSYDIISNNVDGLSDELVKLEDYSKMDDPTQRNQLKILNDTIRLKTPAGVLVTTYTYDPLVGMTSQTDPNGLTTYYEYDGLGRLVRVRDHEGNILQKHEYNYAN